MYIHPLERMSKVHIWLGQYTGKEEQYENYFNQKVPPGQFCIDMGMDEYDEDFIGIIPLFEEMVSIPELLEEVPIEENELLNASKESEKLKIKEGNAVFYLTDFSVVVQNKEKTYNQLTYLGMYNTSL
ncbi:MAG: immunity 22 family protein [Candidatus Azobacteroides sp.]|nr:immunity 22 family protein [Candidatus Azobacteroides sp.]